MTDKTMVFNETLQSGATATGNGTAMSVGGLATVGLAVEGITTATVTIEGSIDGTNYYAVLAYNPTAGSVASAVTADGIWIVPVAGLDKLRARVSAYTSGTIVVTAKGMMVSSSAFLLGA